MNEFRTRNYFMRLMFVLKIEIWCQVFNRIQWILIHKTRLLAFFPRYSSIKFANLMETHWLTVMRQTIYNKSVDTLTNFSILYLQKFAQVAERFVRPKILSCFHSEIYISGLFYKTRKIELFHTLKHGYHVNIKIRYLLT